MSVYYGRTIPWRIHHAVPAGWHADQIVGEHARLGGSFPLRVPAPVEVPSPYAVPEQDGWLHYRLPVHHLAEGVRAGDPACVELACATSPCTTSARIPATSARVWRGRSSTRRCRKASGAPCTSTSPRCSFAASTRTSFPSTCGSGAASRAPRNAPRSSRPSGRARGRAARGAMAEPDGRDRRHATEHPPRRDLTCPARVRQGPSPPRRAPAPDVDQAQGTSSQLTWWMSGDGGSDRPVAAWPYS